MSTVLDVVNETEKEIGAGGSGGGALFCSAESQLGYLVFVSGSDFPFESKFFPVVKPDGTPAQKAQWKEALTKAKALQTEKGVQSNPALTWALTIVKSSCYGKVPNWRVAVQHKTVPRFTKKGEDGQNHRTLDEFIFPALEKLGILANGHYHLKLGYIKPDWEQDPKKPDQANLIMVPLEVYPTEEACRAAAQAFYASAEAADGAGMDLPVGWDEKTFSEFKPQIDSKLQAGTPVPAVAAEFGIPVPWMITYAKKLTG